MARDDLILLNWRRNTAAAAAASNPVLADREWGYETDTGKVKIGDGSTAWNSLPYIFNSAAWSAVTGKPTTVDGYGITGGNFSDDVTIGGGGVYSFGLDGGGNHESLIASVVEINSSFGGGQGSIGFAGAVPFAFVNSSEQNRFHGAAKLFFSVGPLSGIIDGLTMEPFFGFNKMRTGAAAFWEMKDIGTDLGYTPDTIAVWNNGGSFKIKNAAGSTASLGTNSSLPGDLSVAGSLSVGSSTVAGLPTPGTPNRVRWASNARKTGEGSGAGTGEYVYDDGNGVSWKVMWSGAAVTS